MGIIVFENLEWRYIKVFCCYVASFCCYVASLCCYVELLCCYVEFLCCYVALLLSVCCIIFVFRVTKSTWKKSIADQLKRERNHFCIFLKNNKKNK